MINWQHCTRDTMRKTTNAAWPLRRPDGTRFYEPRRDSRPSPEWDETGTGSVAEGDRAVVPKAIAKTLPHSRSSS